MGVKINIVKFCELRSGLVKLKKNIFQLIYFFERKFSAQILNFKLQDKIKFLVTLNYDKMKL